MATASGLLSEDQFRCSICLDVFTDPVTTPCGHNYCNACITQHWDTSDVCQCPLCNKRFYRKPEFSVNGVLSEMVDLFRKSLQLKTTSNANQEPAKLDEVSCDVCGTDAKLKALKSCLVCLVSYCETHLEPHHRVAPLKRHTLIDPVKNLEDYVCQKHDRHLELFCKTDHTCICQFCSELDHKFHHIVSLDEEYEGKKVELGKTEAEVQQMIQERGAKIQEVKHSVELSEKDADKVIAESVEVFTALISCIERSQAELIGVIEEKQKTTEKQAEGFIKDLQQEITQLEKRSSELKQLSHTEDHLHLLQNFTSINNTPPPTKDWTKVNVHQSSHVENVRTAVSQLEKTLSQEMKKLCDERTEERGSSSGSYLDSHSPHRDPPTPPPLPRPGGTKRGKPFFTRDPAELTGTFIFTELKKSHRGLGFSVVDGVKPHEYFLQVSDLMMDGPAALDGNIEPGDVIVCVNDTLVLGHTQDQLATILNSIPVDARVDLSLCRGYPLPFRLPVDSDCNPSTDHELWREYSTAPLGEYSTAPLGENPKAPRPLRSSSTLVTQRRQVARWPELVTVLLVIEKGDKGLGFTVSTNEIEGVHRVKQIMDFCRGGLKVGDVLMEVNNRNVQHMSHGQVVDLLRECPRGSEVRMLVQRAIY